MWWLFEAGCFNWEYRWLVPNNSNVDQIFTSYLIHGLKKYVGNTAVLFATIQILWQMHDVISFKFNTFPEFNLCVHTAILATSVATDFPFQSSNCVILSSALACLSYQLWYYLMQHRYRHQHRNKLYHTNMTICNVQDRIVRAHDPALADELLWDAKGLMWTAITRPDVFNAAVVGFPAKSFTLQSGRIYSGTVDQTAVTDFVASRLMSLPKVLFSLPFFFSNPVLVSSKKRICLLYSCKL